MTTTDTASPARLTIILTDHRPVSIVEAEWPIIAEAEGAGAWMKVRQHADGRRIVYGGCAADDFWHAWTGGLLVPIGSTDGVEVLTIRYIRSCAAHMAVRGHSVANELIAKLPVEEL